MASAPDIFNAAMSLSSPQRAELARQLLLSLEAETVDEDVDGAWGEEIEKRRQAIRAGQPLRDWEDVLADIRKSLASKGQG